MLPLLIAAFILGSLFFWSGSRASKHGDLYGFWLAMVIAIILPATAQAACSHCGHGRLFSNLGFHRQSNCVERGGCSSCSQHSGCPCNDASCTGKPGCQCGDAGCTCNAKNPTPILPRLAKRRDARKESSKLIPRGADSADPPKSQDQPSAPRGYYPYPQPYYPQGMFARCPYCGRTFSVMGNADKAPKTPVEKPEKVAPKPEAKPTAGLSADESRMVAAINQYRADRKLPPLSPDPTLERVARLRVGVFNHNHPRYGWSWEQARRAGFSGAVTDNLAQGYESPEAAVGGHATGWGDERQGHTVGHDMQMKGFTKINGQWVDQHFNLCGVAHQGANYIAVFGHADAPSTKDAAMYHPAERRLSGKQWPQEWAAYDEDAWYWFWSMAVHA